jgi:hypothetical protein
VSLSLSLYLPQQEEEEARVVPRVPFSACLDGYAGDSLVEGYYSLAAGKNTQVGAGWVGGVGNGGGDGSVNVGVGAVWPAGAMLLWQRTLVVLMAGAQVPF